MQDGTWFFRAHRCRMVNVLRLADANAIAGGMFGLDMRGRARIKIGRHTASGFADFSKREADHTADRFPSPDESYQDLAVCAAPAADWHFWRLDWRVLPVNLAMIAGILRLKNGIWRTNGQNRSKIK